MTYTVNITNKGEHFFISVDIFEGEELSAHIEPQEFIILDDEILLEGLSQMDMAEKIAKEVVIKDFKANNRKYKNLVI